MTRPRLLDLFCGAGGASVGYARAGWEVWGLDHLPQPHYPYPERFVQADAMRPPFEFRDFAAIHASPPCQGYSCMRHLPWLKGRTWPMLIDAVLAMLADYQGLWVIENVIGSPLRGIRLCGQMYGLNVYRHRLFSSSIPLFAPPHRPHHSHRAVGERLNSRHIGCPLIVAGHQHGRAAYAAAMGIDWMTRDEMAQAIPPAYTHWIGRQLLDAACR